MKIWLIVAACLIILALVFPLMNDWTGDTYTNIISPITDNTSATMATADNTTALLYYEQQGFLMQYLWWIISIFVIGGIVVAVTRKKNSGQE